MDFLGGSIRIGRISGINVRVHNLYLLWMAFRLINSRGDFLESLGFLAMLFVIILLHEFGHCFGARAVGGDARDILMWPLGGLAFASAPMRVWPQFVTVICGPLVNVVLAVLSAVVLIVATGDIGVMTWHPLDPVDYWSLTRRWQLYVALFLEINVFLFLFNMLPVFPLDGGQLFRCLLWLFMGLNRATILAAQVGIGGALVMGFWGVYTLVNNKDPLGINIGGMVLIMLALFVGFTSWQHYHAARGGMFQEEFLRVDRVLRDKRRTRGPASRAARGLRAWWNRLFGHGRSTVEFPRANPNAGAWEVRKTEERRLNDEVDRILKKVKDQGIHSLTYVERQTLENATRQRQEEERQFDRDTRL